MLVVTFGKTLLANAGVTLAGHQLLPPLVATALWLLLQLPQLLQLQRQWPLLLPQWPLLQ